MEHLAMFLVEFFWVILFLTLFALLGGFLVLPFRGKIFSTLLAAPMAGILVTALGIAGFYSVLGLSFDFAATATIMSCTTFTVLSWLAVKPWPIKINDGLLIIVLVSILLLVYLVNYTSIQFGHPGFLYMDGTDQLGYAQVSDWIRLHTTHHLPVMHANHPYQYWAAYCFKIDPRFGSFYFLAFISWAQHQSGMFAYDSACCILLTAAILAVSSVYSRTTKTFILLLIGLLVCHWFQLGRSGFLGKSFAYPSILFFLGLYFHSIKRLTPQVITTLAIIDCAVSMIYPAEVLILLFTLTASIYLLSGILFSEERGFYKKIHGIGNDFYIAALLILIAIVMRGGLALPSPNAYATPMPADWFSLWKQLFQLSAPVNPVFAWLAPSVNIIFYVSSAILLAGLFFAILKRNRVAATLLLTPIILIFTLWYLQQGWIASELIGIVFPFTLAGFAWLIDELWIVKNKTHRILFFLFMIYIIFRVPLYIETIYRYAGPGVIHTLQFSKVQMDRIARKIENNKVIVDIGESMYQHDPYQKPIKISTAFQALPIFVYFGAVHELDLEWVPKAWENVVGGYLNWPAPKITKTHWYLELLTDTIKPGCKVIDRTNQYQLLYCAQFQSAKP